MMDMQKLIDGMNEVSRLSRSNYHVTLGDLTKAVGEVAPDASVIVDGAFGLGEEESYRGYYSDLAFNPSNAITTAADVLKACERATKDTYIGYKGGDFTYDARTPLWYAHYSACGPPIVSLEIRDGEIHLTTRDID